MLCHDRADGPLPRSLSVINVHVRSAVSNNCRSPSAFFLPACRWWPLTHILKSQRHSILYYVKPLCRGLLKNCCPKTKSLPSYAHMPRCERPDGGGDAGVSSVQLSVRRFSTIKSRLYIYIIRMYLLSIRMDLLSIRMYIIYIRMYVYTYIHMYACMHVCMCVCVCIEHL